MNRTTAYIGVAFALLMQEMRAQNVPGPLSTITYTRDRSSAAEAEAFA